MSAFDGLFKCQHGQSQQGESGFQNVGMAPADVAAGGRNRTRQGCNTINPQINMEKALEVSGEEQSSPWYSSLAVQEHVSSTAAAAVRIQNDKRQELSCYNGCCFFREYKSCETIDEEHAQTQFEFDIMVLELHSLFRQHGIEPSDALVNDALKWNTKAAEKIKCANTETM